MSLLTHQSTKAKNTKVQLKTILNCVNNYPAVIKHILKTQTYRQIHFIRPSLCYLRQEVTFGFS